MSRRSEAVKLFDPPIDANDCALLPTIGRTAMLRQFFIFLDDRDYKTFLNTLAGAYRRTGWLISEKGADES